MKTAKKKWQNEIRKKIHAGKGGNFPPWGESTAFPPRGILYITTGVLILNQLRTNQQQQPSVSTSRRSTLAGKRLVCEEFAGSLNQYDFCILWTILKRWRQRNCSHVPSFTTYAWYNKRKWQNQQQKESWDGMYIEWAKMHTLFEESSSLTLNNKMIHFHYFTTVS